MKLTLRQDKLKKALDIIERVASTSTSLPILGNVLFEVKGNFLKLSSTNLETGIHYWVRAKVEKEGKTTVPARVFSNFVNYLPSSSTLTLELKSNVLHLECGKTKTKINCLSAEEFPIIPEVEKNESVSLSSAVFSEGLSQVASIASPSSIKPEIAGVYFHFEKSLVTLAATDSFRLAEKKFTFEKPFDLSSDYEFILPGRAASFLKGVFEDEKVVEVFFSPNLLMVEVENEDESHPQFRFVSKLVEGTYPDYKEIVPAELDSKAKADRKEFLNHLRRASLFASRINEVKIKLFPKKKEIEVFCQNPELGEHSSVLPADISGKEAEVSFNYKFLIDGLTTVKGEEVILGLSRDEEGEDGPAVLNSPADKSYLYVVMPIQPA